MLALVRRTKPAWDDKVDADPLDIPDAELDYFFRGRKRNFVAYRGGAPGEPAYMKVRVNGKFRPKDTRITHPSDMAGYKKTTLIKRANNAWSLVEDRV